MHIMVLGLRGFPGIQGGVEKHAEQLYTRIATKTDHKIEIITRSAYWPVDTNYRPPKNLYHTSIWSPKAAGVEALVHSLLGTCYAIIKRPDILHVHAVGPALFTPLARLFGIKVVFTHHGPDYDREKWGGLAKTVLRLGEFFGTRYANSRIVVSEVIRNILQRKHNKNSELVFNGVQAPARSYEEGILNEFNLNAHKYVLLVSRVVPEKRQLDLITAFQRAHLPGWKLVIVGDASGADQYSAKVRQAAQCKQDVVLTGFQQGEPLAALFNQAGLFVLPSTHEGLPIAMLEALSYGLPVIASDIPANLAVELTSDHYYSAGDVAQLTEKLNAWGSQPFDAQQRAETSEWVCKKYCWEKIASQTVEIYEDLVAG